MAQMNRGMCDDGGDPKMIDALAVLALEFELEAGGLGDPGYGDETVSPSAASRQ